MAQLFVRDYLAMLLEFNSQDDYGVSGYKKHEGIDSDFLFGTCRCFRDNARTYILVKGHPLIRR